MSKSTKSGKLDFSTSLSATVNLFKGVYEKGIKVFGKEKLELEQRLQRSEKLPLYDITINPLAVN